MQIFGSSVLAALRRRRRSVFATLLPALLLSVTTGSSCLAMTLGHGAGAAPSHAAPAAAAAMGSMEHMGHRVAVETAPAHAPGQPLCPHCKTADQPTATSHSACGAADVAATSGAFAKHASLDAQWLLASDWVLLPSTPAPPLIHGPPPDGVTTPSVPLHIRHCVLLI
jgi:hypothetical protein